MVSTMRAFSFTTLLIWWGILSTDCFLSPVIRQRARPPTGQKHLSVPNLIRHHPQPYTSSLHTKQDDDENPQPIPRRRRLRRAIRKSFIAAAVSLHILTSNRQTAQAKLSYELHEAPHTKSIRPGMSKQQADLVEQGAEIEIESPTALQQTQEEQTTTKTTEAPKPKPKKKAAANLYGDDEDDDDLAFLEDESTASAGAAISSSDKAFAAQIESDTKEQFASHHKGKSSILTLKVALALGLPTFGAQVVRETIRRKREEAYVKKGLEIQKAQKAEYFNITETAADSDLEDELKGLKKNETDTDEDDEDDDDDEDDEDDDEDEDEPEPPSSSSRPKRPRGDGDGGGDGGAGSPGSSSGGSDDPGYGRPSDEDLDRLNKMFGKS